MKVKAMPSCTAPLLPSGFFHLDPNPWKPVLKVTSCGPAGRLHVLSNSHRHSDAGRRARKDVSELLRVCGQKRPCSPLLWWEELGRGLRMGDAVSRRGCRLSLGEGGSEKE